MDGKKQMSTQNKVVSLDEKRSKKRFHLFRFIGEVRSEMQKVSWTEKKELITSTKIVVIATFLLGLSIYVVDLAIRHALIGINSLVRMSIG
jgi:preprotein translocase subunit SecE